MDIKLTISKCKNADYEIRSDRFRSLIYMLFFIFCVSIIIMGGFELGPFDDISPMVKYGALSGFPAILWVVPLLFLQPLNAIIFGRLFCSKDKLFTIINSKTGLYISSNLDEVESCFFLWKVGEKLEMNEFNYGDFIRLKLRSKNELIEVHIHPLRCTLDDAVKTLNDFFGDKVINPKKLT